MKNTKLQIAAIQMASRLGAIDENLARAHSLAIQAANQNADLILFPELMPSGYSLSPRMWSGAEPTNGRTARWLRNTARELGVFVGTSFIEVVGHDFYNTFVLAAPDGRESGRVQKHHAESYFFRGGRGSHVIDTAVGRLGIGICADNQYADLLPDLQQAGIDLMLMPHAWPAPFRTSKAVSEADIERSHTLAAGMASLYSQSLGVPAVFCNQVGPSSGDRGVGLVGRAMNSPDFYFPGLSTIAASDGRILTQLGKDEGLALAEIVLDPEKRVKKFPRTYGRWVLPGSLFIRDILFPADAALGKLWYAFSRQRRKFARLAAVEG
jgi:N-carbamoylputrescine amidase